MTEENKTLHLSTNSDWYDRIESGEIKEEYRDIKPYWTKKVFNYESPKIQLPFSFIKSSGLPKEYYQYNYRKYDFVSFSYGRNKNAMTFRCNGIDIREGNPEWGAEPGIKYYVIKLGEKVE